MPYDHPTMQEALHSARFDMGIDSAVPDEEVHRKMLAEMRMVMTLPQKALVLVLIGNGSSVNCKCNRCILRYSLAFFLFTL